jgi:NAD(P)-dependent dehydrogenase (short-subunit alcohol dehydrogenase family)
MSSKNTILIVGAERGLGLGLATELLHRGWAVVATAIRGSDTSALRELCVEFGEALRVEALDVTSRRELDELDGALGNQRFDVIFMVAGMFGPLHQSIVESTDDELANIMLVNTFGPYRVASRMAPRLNTHGCIAFMSSHRGSLALNVEGGLEPYRASKAALNMLSRGLYASVAPAGVTVLSIHPGWAATAMGTLDGTVSAEIDVDTSVRGVADVLEAQRQSGRHQYLDYTGTALPW